MSEFFALPHFFFSTTIHTIQNAAIPKTRRTAITIPTIPAVNNPLLEPLIYPLEYSLIRFSLESTTKSTFPIDFLSPIFAVAVNAGT